MTSMDFLTSSSFMTTDFVYPSPIMRLYAWITLLLAYDPTLYFLLPNDIVDNPTWMPASFLSIEIKFVCIILSSYTISWDSSVNLLSLIYTNFLCTLCLLWFGSRDPWSSSCSSSISWYSSKYSCYWPILCIWFLASTVAKSSLISSSDPYSWLGYSYWFSWGYCYL